MFRKDFTDRDGHTVTFKYIDSTHCVIVTKYGESSAYHVAQLRDEPYYEELRQWLAGCK